ncbi:hypothetical protein [Saccharomonospora xinjiangensis]|uniref:Uncharacterized protein n=1 Tax=Saccharomonospora xinjiangensis XJ-54 TaxID=882086 RepID=I0V3T7_9PSEU|nr:hypothetical protein SacxiDRAFT_2569 [Saccharomonospora xinjiangensis XJ-54]
MIARDRELLTRLGKVNASIGEVALALMAAQDGGELPADGLREVGEALRTLATDMIARADEVNNGMPVSLAASPTTTCALCHAEPGRAPRPAGRHRRRPVLRRLRRPLPRRPPS